MSWKKLGKWLFGTPTRAGITLAATVILYFTGVYAILIAELGEAMTAVGVAIVGAIGPLLLMLLIFGAILGSVKSGLSPSKKK